MHQNKAAARVIVVGGGFGGTTCAKYLQRFDSSLEIILIEPSDRFVTCPFSNAVLAGIQNIDPVAKKITFRSFGFVTGN